MPLRGTIGETGIINPTFDACGAETWGFGISCVSDALLTPCRRDTRRPTIHLPQQTCIEDAQADKAPGFGALLRQTWGKRPPDDNGTSPQLLLKKNRLPLDAEADFSYGLRHGVTSPPWWCGWSRRCSASPRCSRPATGWRPLGRPHSRSAHRPQPCRSAAHPLRLGCRWSS